MNWNTGVRQFHRWLSIAFAATVAGTVIAVGPGDPPSWLAYSPLPPLFALMFTGLHMVVLPYAAGWRTGRYAREQD